MENQKSEISQFLGAPSGSASGAGPARGQSNADPLPERSSGEQQPQQPAPAPPTPVRRDLCAGMQRRHSTAGHSSQPLAGMPTRPHSSCSGTTALQTQEPSPHDGSTVSSHDPCSSSSSDAQDSSSIPANVLSHSPISNEDRTYPSTSARVWATTLEIAEGKLIENSLPPLDLTVLTSESTGGNVSTVIKQLYTLPGVDVKYQSSVILNRHLMEYWGKILKVVDNYSKATAVQNNPQVTTLVWAAVRAILQVRI